MPVPYSAALHRRRPTERRRQPPARSPCGVRRRGHCRSGSFVSGTGGGRGGPRRPCGVRARADHCARHPTNRVSVALSVRNHWLVANLHAVARGSCRLDSTRLASGSTACRDYPPCEGDEARAHGCRHPAKDVGAAGGCAREHAARHASVDWHPHACAGPKGSARIPDKRSRSAHAYRGCGC